MYSDSLAGHNVEVALRQVSSPVRSSSATSDLSRVTSDIEPRAGNVHAQNGAHRCDGGSSWPVAQYSLQRPLLHMLCK